MKALALTLLAATALLASASAHADPRYYGSDTFFEPTTPPGYGEEFKPGEGYDFGYYPEHVPHVPSTQYGPFGRGSYAQPSYRTPDTTTVQTDSHGRSTYTVMPPPPAYAQESCVPREYVERRVRHPRHERHVKVYRIDRTYQYRVVSGTAIVVPPPCGRIVGVLTPAH